MSLQYEVRHSITLISLDPLLCPLRTSWSSSTILHITKTAFYHPCPQGLIYAIVAIYLIAEFCMIYLDVDVGYLNKASIEN